MWGSDVSCFEVRDIETPGGRATTMRRRSILVLAPDTIGCEPLVARLLAAGHGVELRSSEAQALLALRGRAYDACLLDRALLRGPEGALSLAEMRRLRPTTALLVLVEGHEVAAAGATLGALVDQLLVKPCAFAEAAEVERSTLNETIRRRHHQVP